MMSLKLIAHVQRWKCMIGFFVCPKMKKGELNMVYAEEKESQVLIDHYEGSFIVESNNKTVISRILKRGYKPEGFENSTEEEILNEDRVLFKFPDFGELKNFTIGKIFRAR